MSLIKNMMEGRTFSMEGDTEDSTYPFQNVLAYRKREWKMIKKASFLCWKAGQRAEWNKMIRNRI